MTAIYWRKAEKTTEEAIKDEEAVYRARYEPERHANDELGRGPYEDNIT
jgi:hypothetical protein